MSEQFNFSQMRKNTSSKHASTVTNVRVENVSRQPNASSRSELLSGVDSEISKRIKSIIAEKLNVDERKVVPSASFTNDLGADSLDTVELIMEFEKAFGINIPDRDAEKLATVADAIAYIEANTK